MTISYMTKNSSKRTRYLWIPQDVESQWDACFDDLKIRIEDLKAGELGAAAFMHFLSLTKSHQIEAIKNLRVHLLEQAATAAAADEHHNDTRADVARIESRRPRGKSASK